MSKIKLMRTAPLFIIMVAIFLHSCVSTEKAVYFNNIKEKEFAEINVIPVIQKSDLLSITVSSLNSEATIIFNNPNQSGIGNNPQSGYLVSNEGIILFPILGKITAAGLTVKELTDDLTKTLVVKKLLVDPIVNVRIMNFKVTVLGEVTKPSVVPVPSEKISMLEALGMAGDMTLFAKRDNVLLIRVENGKKITRRVNLNSPDFLESPFYYLKTNDIVYVEPNKAKIATVSRSQQLLPIIASGLTFLIIVIDRIIR
ncbi:MAG: polysaccharide biosynthesis/export family protein [Chitinophagaceae bacterium]